MWAFLSTRLRTWLLFAIAIPVVRYVVHRFSESAQQRRPGARSTSLLGHADSAVTSLSSRRARRKAAKQS
jgi:hypothetical protein